MAESLRYLPETTTALLISYPPIQNIFGIKKNVINDGACLESKCFDLAHMNSLCSPGGVDPSSVQFCSSHFSGFWNPASFTSPSSGRSVLLCWPHFLLWWRPWWEVFCEHLLLSSLILVGILWFGWSMQPQQGPCFRKPKRELKLGALLLVFTNLFSLIWASAQVLNVFQYFISGSGSEGHMSILFSWSRTSNFPEHSWYWGHA